MTDRQIIETLATKVMGWQPIPPRPSGPPEVFPAFFFPIYGDVLDGCIVAYKDKNGSVYTEQWNPFRSMTDAWMIAEKLYIGVLPQSPGSPDDMKFLAVFETHPYDRNIEVYAKTAQEAICKAALEAVA